MLHSFCGVLSAVSQMTTAVFLQGMPVRKRLSRYAFVSQADMHWSFVSKEEHCRSVMLKIHCCGCTLIHFGYPFILCKSYSSASPPMGKIECA